MIITEEAEDPVPLQRPMATHDEAALPRLPLLLQERKLRSLRETLKGLPGREGEPITSHV